MVLLLLLLPLQPEELEELEELEERMEPTRKVKIPESNRWMLFRKRVPTRAKVRPGGKIKISIPEPALSCRL